MTHASQRSTFPADTCDTYIVYGELASPLKSRDIRKFRAIRQRLTTPFENWDLAPIS